jgi:hypothetical protein
MPPPPSFSMMRFRGRVSPVDRRERSPNSHSIHTSSSNRHRSGTTSNLIRLSDADGRYPWDHGRTCRRRACAEIAGERSEGSRPGLKALKDDKPQVRTAAAAALSQMNGKSAAPSWPIMLRDEKEVDVVLTWPWSPSVTTEDTGFTTPCSGEKKSGGLLLEDQKDTLLKAELRHFLRIAEHLLFKFDPESQERPIHLGIEHKRTGSRQAACCLDEAITRRSSAFEIRHSK